MTKVTEKKVLSMINIRPSQGDASCDLLDATASAWTPKKSPRTREILRAREQFVEAMTSNALDAGLENYFMQFAIASRTRRQFA